MKTINVALEDDIINKLSKMKGELSWHDFLVSLTKDMKIIYKVDFNLNDIENLLDIKFEELKR